MRSTASSTVRASCTDDTDHRTDGTHRAGIVQRAIPRPSSSRPVILLLCVTPLGVPCLRPRAGSSHHRADDFYRPPS
jgi:hypothetical protein